MFERNILSGRRISSSPCHWRVLVPGTSSIQHHPVPYLSSDQYRCRTFTLHTSLLIFQGNMLFGLWMSWNVIRIKEVAKWSFQIMDNIIHAGQILRKLMVEKRTVCEIIAGNWKEWFSAMLASICRSKLGLGIIHMIIQLLGSPRAVGIIDSE